MLIWNLDGMVHRKVILQVGFTDDEVGPGTRAAKRLARQDGDMEGFSFILAPFYNTDHDERLNPKLDAEGKPLDTPEYVEEKRKKKEWAEKMIRNHPGFGTQFGIKDPADDVVEIKQGTLDRMKVRNDEQKEKIADLKQKLKEKEYAGSK